MYLVSLLVIHIYNNNNNNRLKLKDLASLALATGQPLTGTKTVLVKRISACLAAFMVDIDRFRDQYPHLASSFDLDSIGLLSSDTVAQLKHSILPRSIISIDVGIRNLAWVELSSRGEILRWSVDDLLGVDGTPEVDGSADPGQAQDLREGAPSQTTNTCTHETTNTKKKAKQSKKAPPPLYDPRSVALRLDQIMQTIVDSDRIEGVIVERQRFRTAGMHSVLDATFKCGVVEGMIHTWLALWEKGRALGSQDKKHKDVVVESISPRAVGTWWSIGSVSRSDNDSSSDESKDSDSEVEASDVDGMSKKSKKTPKYATKKKQSRLIVDGWVQKLGDKENKAGTSDKNHPLRVSCSPTIREWYRLEKKRDDLSDCLLQAVAWYEWREHAMNEALYRYSKAPETLRH
ncbi:hypothetical protein BG000_009999 [Podila horticola]|nr:hypothetical protein BG000_009999 [Podila horticola]